MGINRSAYSYWCNKGKYTDEEKLELYQKIISVYSASKGIYGAPKITAVLSHQGVKCSVSTVSRAMKTLGIKSIVAEKFPKKRNALPDKEKALMINLLKDLHVDKINQVWTTDITYIKTTSDGNLYLISYIDYLSKVVVAWDLKKSQKAVDVIDVLKNAVLKRTPSPGLIIHSDKGPQMRSKLYREYLFKNNFVFSYTSLNHSCDENAAQESFHSLIKKECVYQKKLCNFNEAYASIYDYIENFYNPIRIHSSLGYLSPLDFEASL